MFIYFYSACTMPIMETIEMKKLTKTYENITLENDDPMRLDIGEMILGR